MMIKNREQFLYVDPVIKEISISSSEESPYMVTLIPEADKDIKAHFESPFEQEIITLPDNIKRFSPLLIRHNDLYLRQNTALNRNSQHTLKHAEEVEIKTEDGVFFLTYPEVTYSNLPDHIDKIEAVDDDSINTNKYRALGEIDKGDTVTLEYYLNDSFCLIARENSYEIRVFTTFKDLEIIYETNLETPFYTVNKNKLPNGVNDYLNINPHFSDLTSGFLFITDREYLVREIRSQFEKINVSLEPDVVNRNYIFKVKLLDRFGNPCLTEADITANKGEVRFYHNGIDKRIAQEDSPVYGASDIYGNIYINYTPPYGEIEDNIVISADDAEKTLPVSINYPEEDSTYLFNAISISFPYHKEGIIIDQDTLCIELFAGDESFNPVVGEKITLKYIQYSNNQVLINNTVTTNTQGRATDYFKPQETPEGNIRNCYVKATYEGQDTIQNFKIIGTS